MTNGMSPPSSGSAAGAGAPRELFSSDELDLIEPNELDDPETLRRAIRSMVRRAQ